MTFQAFFDALWNRPPFRWQQRLADQVVREGWPSSVAMPTAAGKTAVIDIALYALVQRADAAARRIFFVVDRRVIVDEAAERADNIARKLAEASPGSACWDIAQALRQSGGSPLRPLQTATLRGGIPRDDSWTHSPLQPIVVCSTVDQIGSALLFRAYGASEYAWPIRAGLAAFDSLVILDEAHTAQPFAQTLERIRQFAGAGNRPLARPVQVVEMSATPRQEGFREDPEDRLDSTLHRRWDAEKRAQLVLVEPKDGETAANGQYTGLVQKLVECALRLRDEYACRVIGVIVNRVATARAVHSLLSADTPENSVLMTGRSRPWDRDRIWAQWRDTITLRREGDCPEQTVFVVATQCIEAGANLDFDALVTECASIDALEQRFGRLNREGRPVVSRAAIVAQKDQTGTRAKDAVYGRTLALTWAWLKKQEVKSTGRGKRKESYVPMGTMALRAALESAGAQDRDQMIMSRPCAPVLMPAHMDLLCQTSPIPAVSPEPAVFLHGPGSTPLDVQVIWRADLSEDDLEAGLPALEACPPSAAEAIAVPVWAVKRWLSGAESIGLSDMEGLPDPGEAESTVERPVISWSGPDDSRVITPRLIRPGMTIVVPSHYGGCDDWGWNPLSDASVKDIGDAVKLMLNRPVLRVDLQLAQQWGYENLAKQLRGEDVDPAEALRNAVVPDGVIRQIVETLQRGSRWIPGVAFVGRSCFDQSSTRSSHTGTETLLCNHLRECREMTGTFAAAVSDPVVRRWLLRAAELHDIGKADPRFQAWLRGGNPLCPDVLIAKSARSGQNRRAIEMARKLAGFPSGGRHELLSVALLADSECDGVLHLIASHHGRCRPFSPCVADDYPVEIRYENWAARSDHRLERAASGIAERFWGLNRELGWHGLAFAEAILRLADHRQSEREAQGNRSAANA
jgi:CRISPR-associated endonuclease/helicase Cas3